jgi:hypothetical protein
MGMCSMKNVYLTILLLLILCPNTWAGDNECPYPEIYIEIDRAYHECRNGQVRQGASCELFLTKLTQILPKYDCRRDYGSDPVPAIWLFGAAMEDYIRLLYELASGVNPMYTDQAFKSEVERAKVIFLSDEFAVVLDGAIAEEYVPLIEDIRNSAH